MSELAKVKPTEAVLKLGGKDRKIKYGFSAWAKLEEKYGGIKNIAQLDKDVQERPFQTIPYLIWIGQQDKEGLNEETLLDDYSMADMEQLSSVLYTALYGSLPKDEAEKKMPESNQTSFRIVTC